MSPPLPRLVLTITTPFDAFDPYIAAALAPFKTSMLSISLGLISPILFVGCPWGLELPAPVAAVTTSIPD